jgi:hypothetical protein
MKKHSLLLLFAASLAVLSCKKESGQSPEPGSGAKYNLNVHLWNSFENDQVAVFIDGVEIFKDKITTNPSLGLAGTASSLRGSGAHIISIKVNNFLVGKKTVVLNNELWVGVNYEAGKFNFTLSELPFLYD